MTTRKGRSEKLKDQLDAFLKGWERREAKVVYDFTTRDTISQTVTTGSLIVYWKPPNWRFDYQSAQDTFSVVQQSGALYFCPEQNRSCIKVLVQMPAPFMPFFIHPTEVARSVRESFIVAGDVVIQQSARTIAGEDARCYRGGTSVPTVQSQTEVCWSGDNILLFLWIDMKDPRGKLFGVRLEAKAEIERSVSDRDLAPPYQVQEAPFPLPTG